MKSGVVINLVLLPILLLVQYCFPRKAWKFLARGIGGCPSLYPLLTITRAPYAHRRQTNRLGNRSFLSQVNLGAIFRVAVGLCRALRNVSTLLLLESLRSQSFAKMAENKPEATLSLSNEPEVNKALTVLAMRLSKLETNVPQIGT